MNVNHFNNRTSKSRQNIRTDIKPKKKHNFQNFSSLPYSQELENQKLNHQILGRREIQSSPRGLPRVNTVSAFDRSDLRRLENSSSETTIHMPHSNYELSKNYYDQNVTGRNPLYQPDILHKVDDISFQEEGLDTSLFNIHTNNANNFKNPKSEESNFKNVQIYNSHANLPTGSFDNDEELKVEPPTLFETDASRMTFNPQFSISTREEDHGSIFGDAAKDHETHDGHPSSDRNLDKDIEQRVIQTFLKFMGNLQPDSVPNIPQEDIANILIDENSDSRRGSTERSQEYENKMHRNISLENLPESRSEIITQSSMKNSNSDQKINSTPKSVRF